MGRTFSFAFFHPGNCLANIGFWLLEGGMFRTGNSDGNGQESKGGRTWKLDESSWGSRKFTAMDSKKISAQ